MLFQPPPPTTTSAPNPVFIRLLSGPLHEFEKYSRQEQSKWLIDIAHDICDPSAMRGSLSVWNGVAQWRPVVNTDPLTASVYLYVVPVGVIVGLSKFSARIGKSVTTVTGDGSTTADRVKGRDEMCWASRIMYPLINSYICPKRMGDHLARAIYQSFSSAPPPSLTIHDERFGISLSATLDKYFNIYELGLRSVAGSVGLFYECHNFRVDIPGHAHTMYGQLMLPTAAPLIHGHSTGPPHPELPNNPPPGLLRWHYLQCVLKKFGHDEYKSLPNISYSELPLPMDGDSDDDGTDSEADWPSAALDRGRAAQANMIKADEHLHSVANWVATV
ncbi:hypothetical protein B0H17DRAFT_915859 [Mycena rosella]|uniref:Uncharacterized protein n=1 Tax=Mycena rosella TaxID=1033263 RepID=A0AAD7MC36_MYCRO|nr:hypothetical protein B0H17DRAFT_915859 [Mycena rosella]